MLATGGSYEPRGLVTLPPGGYNGYPPNFPAVKPYPTYPAVPQDGLPAGWAAPPPMAGPWGQLPKQATSVGLHGSQSRSSSPGETPLVLKQENGAPPPPVSPPPQKERFSYTRYQLELLNGIYEQVRYPTSVQKQLVAKRVGITRDQVKIWFQNRRRKDVVAQKNSDPRVQVAKLERKMVPDDVMTSVISELSQYAGENGKFKTKTKRVRKSNKAEPYPTGDVSPVSVCSSVKEDSNSPSDYTPNGDVTALTSPETRCSSVSSTTLTVPSAADLDMVAPPNVVAPPSSALMAAGLYTATIHREANVPSTQAQGERYGQAFSPIDSSGPQYFAISPTTSNSASPNNSIENTPPITSTTVSPPTEKTRDDFIPPNKVAPPSEPINFDLLAKRQINQPLKVMIPQSQIPKLTHVENNHQPPPSQRAQHTNALPQELSHYQRDNIFANEDRFARFPVQNFSDMRPFQQVPTTHAQTECSNHQTSPQDKQQYPYGIHEQYSVGSQYPIFQEQYQGLSPNMYQAVPMQLYPNMYYGPPSGHMYPPERQKQMQGL